MGNLFSRAFKRLTQGGSQSRNQSNQQEQRVEQQDKNNHDIRQPKKSIIESIPVGQSIDSAEYAALAINNSPRQQEQNTDDQPLKNKTDSDENNDNKQGVEEAVIKIQALVRGHLARKALKDAHHHHHSVPPPNAFGQGQFDDESLTTNPPSAVFLPASPLSLAGDFQQPVNNNTTISDAELANRTPLETIAELTETQTISTSRHQLENNTDNERRKLASLCLRSASSPSKLEPLGDDLKDSTSPAPSETNASIDLNCVTPTSASSSIVIMDHNLRPTDMIASVLHHREQDKVEIRPSKNEDKTQIVESGGCIKRNEVKEEDFGKEGADVDAGYRVPPVGTPDSFESEEAAAIRIQSAFRGYRTRKNSPYRTRSPNSVVKRNALKQQEATVLHEYDEISLAEQLAAGAIVQEEGRRSSRSRQRETTPIGADQVKSNDDDDDGQVEFIIQGAPSLEEFTTTDDKSTVKEASQLHEIGANIESSMETASANNQVNSHRESQKPATSKQLSISSNDIDGESDANNLDSLGLSAALETHVQTTNDDLMDKINSFAPRPSEASVELDTDSSALGAALSLNEEISLAVGPQFAQAIVHRATVHDDEDKSLGASLTTDELESEARRLVDEMTADHTTTDECVLEEATNQLEAELENVFDNVDELALLDNEDEAKHRATELESDDIERRDPRGQASEERAKSPQLRAEDGGWKFELTENNDGQEDELGVIVKGSGNLELEQQHHQYPPLEEAFTSSGPSSPALHSSAPASSSDEESGDNSDHEKNIVGSKLAGQEQRQPQEQHQSTIGRNINKKKNSNRKRKGKK